MADLKKPRTSEDVMREMIGGQAVTIARLTAALELLRVELDAAKAELATLKPAEGPKD